MRISVVGPGRAGMAIALAARAAGHRIVAVVARTLEGAVSPASRVDASPLEIGAAQPDSDLVILAVRDDAIVAVAGLLAEAISPPTPVVHLSGLKPLTDLAPLRTTGHPVGAFHPLQTLPTADAGARALAGAWIAVTTEDESVAVILDDLAHSLGAVPFRLDDAAKPLYHAAAAAAANFPLASLAMAHDLFDAAGVPFEAARPLVEAVVANAFDLGPRAALTGPVARGDVGTVRSQLAAVDASSPMWTQAFAASVAALARITGRGEEFAALLGALDKGHLE